jgi:hypothetical protein
MPAVDVTQIEHRILLIRDEKVIVDADPAGFYGVATKRLNEQVKRNQQRFPRDFIFELTLAEKEELVAKCDQLSKLKYSTAMPYAFTEHRALMAASVLNSPRAVELSVFIVRAFVRLRETLMHHAELATKLADLERHLAYHDAQIMILVEAIKRLMDPRLLPKTRRIGYHKD